MTMTYNGWHKIELIETEIKGEKALREKLHLMSAVAGIVTDAEGKICLVQQYRPTIIEYVWEVPAGVIDKEYSNERIMLEELEEECDIEVNEVASIDITSPAGYYMVMGSSDAFTNMYRIKLNTVKEDYYEVDDKDVEAVMWTTFDLLEEVVLSGKIKDSKTIFAYNILKGEQNK